MWYYYVIAGIVVVIAILATIFFIKKQPKKPLIDASTFVQVFPKEQVQSIAFQRNKIAVTLVDGDAFQPEMLQQLGAKGISIVGDTVKFYIEGSPEDNQQLYQQLKDQLERM